MANWASFLASALAEAAIDIRAPGEGGGGGKIGNFMKQKAQYHLCWLTTHKGL